MSMVYAIVKEFIDIPEGEEVRGIRRREARGC